MDNGKEPGGAAGGDGEGWKAILRKRRDKFIETRVEGNNEEKKISIETRVEGVTIRRVIWILASDTDTVFVNSTNICTNIETAMLSRHAESVNTCGWLWQER